LTRSTTHLRGNAVIRWRGVVAACAAALVISSGLAFKANGAESGAIPQSAAVRAGAQAELEALINAAKAEGEVTFFLPMSDPVGKRVGDAFTAKYAIKTQHLRLGGVQIQQRYAAEAESGLFAADVLITESNAVAFAEEGIRKGWLEAVSQAGLPVLKSGEFPAKFVTGPTAIVQIAPWGLMFNTDKVKPADIPKDWPSLLDSKWSGQVLIVNPGLSNAYVQFWGLLLDKYGESFFAQIRRNVRPVGVGSQAVQALGAGEASLLAPASSNQILGQREKGVPMGRVVLEYTTGVEQHVMLTARTKAKHPNAARLFGNYILSREGNTVLNGSPGAFTIYDVSQLPKQYQPPKAETDARREQILKLLGFQP
jgi:iron(III) transport system substrate-binding protein